MTNYFTFGLFCSAMAFCLLGWYSTSIYIYAYIPSAHRLRTTFLQVLFGLFKVLLSIGISFLIWWHIAKVIGRFLGSFIDDAALQVTFNNVQEHMSHISWIIGAIVILYVIGKICFFLSNIIMPIILYKITIKLSNAKTKFLYRVLYPIFLYINAMGKFIFFAISLIFTIPLLLCIFG